MYTWTFICAVAILSAASPFKALPVPPESSRAQEEFNSRMAEDAMGFLSKDISSIGERRAADFYSMLPKRDKVLIELQGGTMEKLEDNANLVDDMKLLLWKLTTAQHLQQRRFTKSDQAAPKASKRACFWKYCVSD
ncbi:urotensin-related peptide 1 isoform X2 [Leucoraja erinacea]|uniref:urotensin-related peptide 1 isoform X2 n=1 Tax=Leucoraja erinaceus TaxID=7782 RepID=UPI002455419C|nr:urotensin-related peptide 1 isoform X2 [Leucoraja erinacea]